MRVIGYFNSFMWGRVTVQTSTYMRADGPLAVLLFDAEGERLTNLSVNMDATDGASHDSRDLPADCFYVKTWEENSLLAFEALASGLFIQRPDLPVALSGFVAAPVWQIAKPEGVPA